MENVRGLFLGIPHGTKSDAVTTNENTIMSSFKSSRDQDNFMGAKLFLLTPILQKNVPLKINMLQC